MSVSVLLTIIGFLGAAFGGGAGMASAGASPTGGTVGCDLAARSVEDVVGLGQAVGGVATPVALADRPVPLPAGEAIEAETAAEVGAVAAATAACFEAGEPRRGLAGFSDEFLGRIVVGDGAASVRSALDLMAARPGEANALSAFAPTGATEALRLPDGRVGLLRSFALDVAAGAPEARDVTPRVLFVFAPEAGGWRLDDVLFVAGAEPGTPAS